MSESNLAIKARLLKDAILETDRFKGKAWEAYLSITKEDALPIEEQRYSIHELAAAKRASMDLTRALSKLRR